MVLPALAELEDLQVRLQTDTTDTARAEALLLDASAAVRGYTGQEFTEGTSTAQVLRPKNGYVRLPQRPVTAVTAVVDLHDNPILYTWDGDDRVYVSPNVIDTFAWEPWRFGITKVKVTYTHGYEEIPTDVIAVVCQIAARALGLNPSEAGISQESIAGYSYSIGSAGASGALGMLSDERAVLDRYRHPQIGSFEIYLR